MDASEIYFFEKTTIAIESLKREGLILDIGGGGEGIMGRIGGSRVVAIDNREEELLEAPPGPLKIVMDARNLKFVGNTFALATAFFAFMYFENSDDVRSALSEIYRVLRPEAQLHIWDVALTERPDTEKELFAVPLQCRFGSSVVETAYGCPWPDERRGCKYYSEIAEDAGFRHVRTDSNGMAFHSIFQKLACRSS